MPSERVCVHPTRIFLRVDFIFSYNVVSLIMYLNIITDKLPSTGPISLFKNNTLFFSSFTSCLIVLMSILTLRIDDNHQMVKPVPKSWTNFVRLMSVLDSHKRPPKSKVHLVVEIEEIEEIEVTRKDIIEDCQAKNQTQKIPRGRKFLE